jgi:hypothetical protein
MSQPALFPPPSQLIKILVRVGGVGLGNRPVRNSEDSAMFIRMFGARHTMDIAIDSPPAARRRKSMNAQAPINPLDTIVIALLNGCR